MANNNSLWTCPKCGKQLAGQNRPHSCGDYTLVDFLAGKSEKSLMLFKKFVEELDKAGLFIYVPAKTRIGFQARTIFAAIDHLGKDDIQGHLVLPRECKSKKFTRVEVISPNNVIHYFKITDEKFFDAEFAELLAESYAVGEQKHLK